MFEFGIGLVIGGLAVIGIWGVFYWRKQWLESYIMAEEAPDGDYRVVMRKRSPTQRIAVAESEGIYYVYADGSEMMSTDQAENQYTEAIVHVPMAAAVNRESILIIGSGAGITAREVLRYTEVESITAVDVDPIIVQLGKEYEPLVNFTNGSLHHPRVKTVLADGREYLENCNDRWDVVIIDLPDPSSKAPELSKLFSVEFYRLLKTRLNPGGAAAIACSVVSAMPEYLAAVQATLKTAGFHVVPYHWDYIVEFAIDWGFCLATLKPIKPDAIEPLISVKHLSEDRLEDMFVLPRYLRVDWDEDEVQTDRNSLLIEIVEREFEY